MKDKKYNTTNPFLSFLGLLKLKTLIFFSFGASTFGHVTVLCFAFLKKFLYYFKDRKIMKKG